MTGNDRIKIILIILFLVIMGISVPVYAYMQGSIGAAEDGSDVCRISYEGDRAEVSDDTRAYVAGSSVTIGKAGSYHISGASENARLIIDTQDADEVYIVLEDLDIACAKDAPFCVKNSGDVRIFLSGSNALGDAGSDQADSERSKACFYSKSDVTLQGDGSLTIDGDYWHGISVRGDLRIESGSLQITAARNAIDVRDSLKINGGSIRLDAGNDGISASDSEDINKGEVHIRGGHIELSALDEGISAAKSIDISGGSTYMKCGSQLFKCSGEQSIDKSCVIAETIDESVSGN